MVVFIYQLLQKKWGWCQYFRERLYNNSFHSTIKSTPQKVFDGKQFNTQQVFYIPNPFDVGDTVRLKKEIFSKIKKCNFFPFFFNSQQFI